MRRTTHRAAEEEGDFDDEIRTATAVAMMDMIGIEMGPVLVEKDFTINKFTMKDSYLFICAIFLQHKGVC